MSKWVSDLRGDCPKRDAVQLHERRDLICLRLFLREQSPSSARSIAGLYHPDRQMLLEQPGAALLFLYRPVRIMRPALVIRTRATSSVRLRATTLSVCAVANPARISSSIARP
jgi:hypothetical protein